MADTNPGQTAKLQLDGETREMVSENEPKKRIQKRAKKAARDVPKSTPTPTDTV